MLLGGRSLLAVALVSSLGYLISFGFALVRLTVATQQLRLDYYQEDKPTIIEDAGFRSETSRGTHDSGCSWSAQKSVLRWKNQEPAALSRKTFHRSHSHAHGRARNRPVRGDDRPSRR